MDMGHPHIREAHCRAYKPGASASVTFDLHSASELSGARRCLARPAMAGNRQQARVVTHFEIYEGTDRRLKALRRPLIEFKYSLVDCAYYGFFVVVIVLLVIDADHRLQLYVNIALTILGMATQPVAKQDLADLPGAVRSQDMKIHSGRIMTQHAMTIPS